MTYKELEDKMGPQTKADWTQQDNGGGWIHKSAVVDTGVFIGEDAIVFSGRVSGNAQVYGDARVSGNAQVFGNAWVFGDARVCGDARVSGNAQVFGNAWVFGNARVSGNAWVKSPLFIVGSRHSLTNTKHGYIQIGCHCKTIDWWLENYKDIGQKEDYTASEIEEYGLYIQLFKKIGK